MRKSTIQYDDLEIQIKRMVALCDSAIGNKQKKVEIKIQREYKGEKEVRVIGDLFGKPIAYTGNVLRVSVDARKLKNKLNSQFQEIERERKKLK